MKDLMSIKVGETKGGAPVARIRIIPANKYSATYMALVKKVKS